MILLNSNVSPVRAGMLVFFTAFSALETSPRTQQGLNGSFWMSKWRSRCTEPRLPALKALFSYDTLPSKPQSGKQIIRRQKNNGLIFSLDTTIIQLTDCNIRQLMKENKTTVTYLFSKCVYCWEAQTDGKAMWDLTESGAPEDLRRRALSNGFWYRQQPPTGGPVQVHTEWMEAFFRVREARWHGQASWASVADCGKLGLEGADILELNPEYCLVLPLRCFMLHFPWLLELESVLSV